MNTTEELTRVIEAIEREVPDAGEYSQGVVQGLRLAIVIINAAARRLEVVS